MFFGLTVTTSKADDHERLLTINDDNPSYSRSEALPSARVHPSYGMTYHRLFRLYVTFVIRNDVFSEETA